MNDSDLNTSWRLSQEGYKSASILQKAGYTAVRWAKNAGRAIVHPFKKVGNSLWEGFCGCCSGFKEGCSKGWEAIEFKQSQYGLPKEESQLINN